MREVLGLYGLALAAAWWVGADGPIYWDSFGYVIQAITNRAGGLMLGRPTFVLLSHLAVRAWRALGGDLASVEPLLRTAWMLVSALGAPMLASVASRTGASRRASLAAGAFLALSPAVAHTSRAVLTDGPSMSVMLFAVALGLRAHATTSVARMFVAGLVLGVATGMREPSVVHLLSLLALAALAPRRRTLLGAAAIAGVAVSLGVVVAGFAHAQPSYADTLSAWSRAMAAERAQHAYGVQDFAMFWAWVSVAGLVPLLGLIGAVRAGWRPRDLSRPLAALSVLSGLQLCALAFYQDIGFSPRYLVGALPLGLMLPCALAIDGVSADSKLRQRTLALSVVVAMLAGPIVRRFERTLRRGLATLPARLSEVPDDAAIVTGQLCPAVVYHRELARLAGPHGMATPRWVQVCPGWRWPASLSARLDSFRAEGRTVVIDLRGDSWIGERQLRCRREAAAYVAGHPGEVVVWR